MSDGRSRRQVLSATGSALALGALGVQGGLARGATTAADPPATRWTSTFDREARDVPEGAVANGDGTVTVGGYTGTEDETPWVFTVDETGERSWETVLEDAAPMSVSGIAAADDGYVLAGDRSTGEDGSAPALLRVDGTGEPQWRRTYDPSGDQPETSGVVAVEDGHVLYGTAYESNDVVTWVLGVDGDGERRWGTTLSEYDLTLALGGASAAADGVLLLGAVRLEPTDSSPDPPYDGWVAKVDRDGSVAWRQRYTARTTGGAGTVQVVYDAARIEDGYLLAGYVAPTFGGADGRGWAVTVGTDGTKNRSTIARPDAGSGGFFTTCATEDGYALVGRRRTVETAGQSIWAVGVDATLSRNWRFTARYDDTSAVDDVVPTEDGGFTVVGTTTNFEAEETDALVRKYGGDPPATPTPTPTATPTPTDSPTPTPTSTPSPTSTATPPEPTATATAAAEPAASTETTSGSGPGFGVVGTLAALTGSALFRRVRANGRK